MSADDLIHLATITELKVVQEKLVELLAHSPIQVAERNPQTDSLSHWLAVELLTNGLGSTGHSVEEDPDGLVTAPGFLDESLTVQDSSVVQLGIVEEHQDPSQELQS